MTDAQLMAEFAATQAPWAFEELVRRHGPMVRAVGRRMTGSAADADDVVQEVFLTLARKASRVAWKDSLAGWLHQTAFRAAKQHCRSQTRRRRHEAGARRSEESVETSVEVSVDQTETVHLVDRELALLPEKYRAPIVLHHLQQMKYDQAAKKLGCKENTFAVRLRRGRQLLRDRLARRGVMVPVAALFAWLDDYSNAAGSTGPVTPPAWPDILQASSSVKPFSWRLALVLTLVMSAVGIGSFSLIYHALANDEPTQFSNTLVEKKSAKEKTSSKPVQDNGLQMWVTIPSEHLHSNKRFQATLHFKNVSKKNIKLPWLSWYNQGLKVVARSTDGKQHWEFHQHFAKVDVARSNIELKPGQVHQLKANTTNMVWARPDAPKGREALAAAAPMLPVGTYKITALYDQAVDGKSDSLDWKGSLASNPLTLSVSHNPPSSKTVSKTKSSQTTSESITRDGLEMWVSVPAPRQPLGQNLLVNVHFKNSSERPLQLANLNWYAGDLQITVMSLDGKQTWNVHAPIVPADFERTSTKLEPGNSKTLALGQVVMSKADKPNTGDTHQPPRLPEGKFYVSATYSFDRASDPETKKFWHGQVTTPKLMVEIVDPVKLRTSEPITQNGLQFWLTLPGNTIKQDENLQATVHFKNVSTKPLPVHQVAWNTNTLKLMVVSTDGKRKYELDRRFFRSDASMDAVEILPGKTHSLSSGKNLSLFPQDGKKVGEGLPPRLPKGTYTVVAQYTARFDPKLAGADIDYSNVLVTKPVVLTVLDPAQASDDD